MITSIPRLTSGSTSAGTFEDMEDEDNKIGPERDETDTCTAGGAR